MQRWEWCVLAGETSKPRVEREISFMRHHPGTEPKTSGVSGWRGGHVTSKVVVFHFVQVLTFDRVWICTSPSLMRITTDSFTPPECPCHGRPQITVFGRCLADPIRTTRSRLERLIIPNRLCLTCCSEPLATM